jgi:hypothetical protein
VFNLVGDGYGKRQQIHEDYLARVPVAEEASLAMRVHGCYHHFDEGAPHDTACAEVVACVEALRVRVRHLRQMPAR